jgi:sRNA-binding protein
MLSRNLERLDEEIHELQGKVAGLTDAAKAEWAEKMTELDAKRRETGERLEAVKKSTGEAWERLREGADKAWEELEQAVKAAVKEF